MHETLTDILRQVLKAAPPAKREAGELRGTPRYSVRTRVAVQPIIDNRTEGRPEKVWMRDISSSGVGFLHTRAIKPPVELLVHLPELEDLSPLRCRVVRCERAQGDVFVIGAVFTAAPGAASAASVAGPALTTLSSAQVTRLTAHVTAKGNTADAPDTAATVAEKVRRAAGNSATPTALIALDNNVLWTNEAFARLVDIPADGLARRTYDSFIHPLEYHTNSLRAAPTTRARTRYGRRDGSAVVVDVTINTLRDVAGRSLFFLLVAEPARDENLPAVIAPATLAADRREDEADRIRRAMFE